MNGDRSRTLIGRCFWFAVGGTMGFGMVAFGLGLIPVLLGYILALYGLRRFGRHDFWMVLVGMGIVPTILLTLGYLAAQQPNTFVAPHILIAVSVFGAVALIGILWGLIGTRRVRV